MNKRALMLVALFALLALFGYGLSHLFSMRFAAGDTYPHYSSFRSDPLGTRVYFESLAGLEGAAPKRFLEPLNRLPHGRDTTLFLFGLPWNEMAATEEEYRIIEGFVRAGGRLVITLYPELGRPRFFYSGYGTNAPTFKRGISEDEVQRVSLREKWGFGYAYVPLARDGNALSSATARRIEPGPFPESLSWHGSLVFTNLDFPWRVLYARGNDPVLIERQHGNGSIVLATDSYFVSNEAMRRERATDLLAWLPGGKRDLIFDETHLGVQQSPGVATLARRYRLHGGAAALLVLAALFIWKNAASFVPRNDHEKAATPVLGRTSASGFENLLRRGVPPRALLQTALDEWHKASRVDGRATPARRDRIRALVQTFNAAEKPNLVETYREIARVLNRKK